MNDTAKKYWEDYWQGKEKPSTVTAWAFGVEADHLARLVMDGVKTATCSSREAYRIESEPLPKKEDHSIILNSSDEPVAIIKTTNVDIVPFNEVSEEFARAEGEGNRSYQYWWDAHVKFFNEEAEELGYEFSEDMDVVCERFQLIHVNPD
ncbi:ASCH domain-containing protein [Halobacillus sp. H74]|uniref:ASCH domain-containing protein n=1 Tax=Halobacillus sp. H74 TaxID=3457436 RepID=UPI003FCE4D3F